jgi:signal transduction histidine kinase
MRMLGHDLRHALARAAGTTERLARHLVAGAPTQRDLAELKHALSEADYVAAALLDGGPELDIDRPPLCVNSFVLELEPALRGTLNPEIVLNIRLSAAAGLVSANGPELNAIIRSLIDQAVRSMPEGGELAIATGWLDISGIASRDRVRSRHHVRLTISATARRSDGEPGAGALLSPLVAADSAAIEDSVAAMVGELGGWLILESADGGDRRMHLCLPAATEET